MLHMKIIQGPQKDVQKIKKYLLTCKHSIQDAKAKSF